uniref:Sorting nexin 25 n=1 Tax=Molossus molossus TaxID=27622 RepID=A0A7J8I9Z9_MOLMO|nr:hypothetical protein HJG59_010693 [Molossus molossus]
MKADLLRVRNVKRYMNQLTVAKQQWEKRVRILGGPDYDQQEDGALGEGEGPQSQKILQFEDILANTFYREHFRMYMDKMDKRALISFWESAEYLKNANKNEIPQLGDVYEILKDRYYPSFIVSDLYEKLMIKEEEKHASQLILNKDDVSPGGEAGGDAVDEGTSQMNEQASFTVNKLRGLNVSLRDVGGVETKNWTVPRRLSELQNLHRKLSECFPSLKKVQLPSLSKLPFKSMDQKFMEKSKNQLNKFLQNLLSDESLYQSEALYAFLSPSPDYLKVIDAQGEKSTFSLSSFLERLPRDFFSHQEEEPEEDGDLSDYGADVDGRKDSLAEPCFMSIGEIFELRAMLKWVRRTLIALVQVTFGRTINKQIWDTVNWIFREQMLVYYINIFRDAFWPNGKLAPPTKIRSEEQSQEAKQKAQQKLLENIPDVRQSLVGQQNARHGIIKIFNALQETRANKHLLCADGAASGRAVS